MRVVAAVVERDGRYLITQRRIGAVLAILWEFPGGKVEPGEARRGRAPPRAARTARRRGAHRQKARREAARLRRLSRRARALRSRTLVEGKPLRALRVKDFRWVASSEFDKYPFPDADQQTMDQLLGFTRAG